MNTALKNESEKDLYLHQNKAIHKARTQISMSLEGCRELAKQIGGKPSISSLSLKERWDLIEDLKLKGARVYNPSLGKDSATLNQTNNPHVKPKDVYPLRLAEWKKRFPGTRPGFASSEQLAWIHALWELDFDDGRAGKNGIRGFIYRQTKNLENGPVSDLAFLRSNHVAAVMMPLLAKARENINQQ